MSRSVLGIVYNAATLTGPLYKLLDSLVDERFYLVRKDLTFTEECLAMTSDFVLQLLLPNHLFDGGAEELLVFFSQRFWEQRLSEGVDVVFATPFAGFIDCLSNFIPEAALYCALNTFVHLTQLLVAEILVFGDQSSGNPSQMLLKGFSELVFRGLVCFVSANIDSIH